MTLTDLKWLSIIYRMSGQVCLSQTLKDIKPDYLINRATRLLFVYRIQPSMLDYFFLVKKDSGHNKMPTVRSPKVVDNINLGVVEKPHDDRPKQPASDSSQKENQDMTDLSRVAS